MVCQKKHWKVGGHRAECVVLAAAATVHVVGEATVGDGDDRAEGKKDEAGGSGLNKEKKGGKKGKKGRR